MGETHEVEGTIEACKNGLHASTRLIDALEHAPGSILYLVELSGDVDDGGDKVAASRRKYLAEFDATDLLRRFAKRQALINVEKIEPYCSPEEYRSILQYLNGDDTLAAESAWSAWLAAESARLAWSARSAARSAANEMLTSMVREATGWDI